MSHFLSDNGGVIISWPDNRNSNIDIFASKLLSNGILAGVHHQSLSQTNGNWNNPATWLGGVVPPATAEVTIRHNVLVTINTTCYSLRVESLAGKLVIQTGINLTITN